MATLTEIYEFLSVEIGIEVSRLKEETDLFKDLGVDGDDFFELMEAFKKEFSADLSNYRWDFHHGAEGFCLLSFFAPKTRFIPVTSLLLLKCANTGKWPFQYPEI